MSTGVSSGSETVDRESGAAGPPPVQLRRGVSAPLTHVWELLVSPAGAHALLGEGAMLGGKGESYHCADGTGGVVRSYHPLEQLRVSWHERRDTPASMVEVDLRADGDRTVVDLTQTAVPEGADVDGLRTRWGARLDALAAAAEATATPV